MSINKIDEKAIVAFSNDLYGGNALDQYQEIASGSAIYPGQGTPLGLIYCALKLNGEAGELAEHVGKALRDDGLMEGIGEELEEGCGRAIGQKLSYARHALIVKEVGDCLWYLGAICRELNITLSDAALENLNKLALRQQRGTLQGSGDDR